MLEELKIVIYRAIFICHKTKGGERRKEGGEGKGIEKCGKKCSVLSGDFNNVGRQFSPTEGNKEWFFLFTMPHFTVVCFLLRKMQPIENENITCELFQNVKYFEIYEMLDEGIFCIS